MNSQKTDGPGLAPAARAFIILAACTMILTVLANLFVNLLADPADPESMLNVRAVLRIVNLVSLVFMALALFSISRVHSSPLWRICFFAFAFRVLTGLTEIAALLGLRPESRGMQLALLALLLISIVAAWMCLGATLIIRRDDGEAGLAVATGAAILVGMSLWIVHFLALLGVLEFGSVVLWVTEVAGALTQTFSLLLALQKPHGLVAAALVWLQLVFFVVAIVGGAGPSAIWIAGLLAIAAAVAGGISFLQSRKLAAPKVAAATGAILLACALVSLVMLAFVRETGLDLPWMAQRILFAAILTVSMAAFTLAAVHHLQAAGRRT